MSRHNSLCYLNPRDFDHSPDMKHMVIQCNASLKKINTTYNRNQPSYSFHCGPSIPIGSNGVYMMAPNMGPGKNFNC